MKNKKILVTGGAGFIGSHLVERLLSRNNEVVVIDNFNDFYDPAIKRDNIASIEKLDSADRLQVVEGDIRSLTDVEEVFSRGPFDAVVHLAAMAGVRPSLENPALYVDVNLRGTQNLLDAACAQASGLPLFVFASSSSVYGAREPGSDSFKESDRTDRPVSPYAATKMSGEMICHSQHVATGLDIVCLRFFTVFGPRQRPDLAIHKFCRLIDEDKPIDMYGDGKSQRDYTYIGDIVDGITGVLELEKPGFEILNLGRNEPVLLCEMIECIEKSLGKKATINRKPMQKGDVPNTFANIDKARRLIGYEPGTSFDKGVAEFVEWYIASKKSKKASSKIETAPVK